MSKYHVLPGIADSKLVSLEQVGAKGFFLRHQKYVVFLHERPKNENGVYDADASFKLVRDGDKVRFEAGNRPGMFLAVREDGVVILARDPDPAKSTFLSKKD
ncbi:MAG: AbfB domain-containing protein [Chthoniobacter sp.]|uniref:AbfB domain-containing protein n=1 Tax=Chthoniobacter sp. TaxID=2510640 RepID=UPI0032A7B79E